MSRSPLSRPVSRGAAGAVVTLLLVAGSACSSDDSDPGDTASTPATSSATTSPSGASTSPSDSSSAGTVTPADGPLLTMPEAQMNAPDGWKKAPAIVSTLTEARPPQGGQAARLGSDPAFGDMSLDQQVRSFFRISPYDPQPKRQPDQEIDGVKFFHLAGPITSTRYYDTFGAIHDGHTITIEFDQLRSASAADRQSVIDSVLATFHFAS